MRKSPPKREPWRAVELLAPNVFPFFLTGLAVDAKLGHGTGLETGNADIFTAVFADAVGPFVQPLDGGLDLADQAAFAVTDAQCESAIRFGGRNLSGGQKQRLTIARALVGKPDILILDDSASALDYATDAALRKALAALPGDLTVFIVSQRAASLQHADQIIVLDDGRMVGLGRPAELLESCPVYKEIYESQFKKGDAQK